MQKILLTGGLGFFCSRLRNYYDGKFEFLVTDRHNLDICDNEAVKRTFDEFKPDYVIHAAAIAVTDFCNKNPDIAYKINVEGAINVAKAAKAAGSKMIFISSEQVFNGNPNPGPFSEDDKAVPNTVYGQNKLEAEGILREIIDTLWIVRFTWLFGLPEKGCGMADNILWGTIKSIMAQETIYASPNEFRGMGYVNEMLENIIKLFELPYGTYHLGAENDLSRYEIVEEIFNCLGLSHLKDKLLVIDKEKYKDKARDVRLSTKKAQDLGIHFSNSFDAVKKCIDDYSFKIQ